VNKSSPGKHIFNNTQEEESFSILLRKISQNKKKRILFIQKSNVEL
jgi:hypothetical protein